MYYLFVVIHVVACISLIFIVLMQSGKGGGLSGLTGGGGGGEQLFGASTGMALIKKVTVGFVLTFLLSSLVLTVIASRKGARSVTSQYPMAPVSSGQR